jgi:MFS family permease
MHRTDRGPATGLRSITKRQWTALAGTMLGWGMEGFDIALFALVVQPAVTDLLGPGASSSDIVFHTGLAVSVFLGAWALGAIVFGVVADYIGRVRILTLGIILYAVFTALSATADSYWLLVVFRFIAGLGSGIEGPVGAALMAETWNNRYRARATGIMMSGYAGGFFLASWAYGLLSPHGWRVTLAVAVLPALLVIFIRRHVHEPVAMKQVQAQRRGHPSHGAAGPDQAAVPTGLGAPDPDAQAFVLRRLFTRPLLRPTVLCTLIQFGALICFWATSTWTPPIVRELSIADGLGPQAAGDRVTLATAMLNLGGLVGYASWGFLADWIGRRGAFLVGFGATAVGVGYLYPFAHTYSTFLMLLPLVGFGIFGTLAGPAVYFPEIFPVGVRVSAISVSNSLGRFLTAPGPLVTASIAAIFFHGNLGLAVSTMCCALVVGVVATLLSQETRTISPRAGVAASGQPHQTMSVD